MSFPYSNCHNKGYDHYSQKGARGSSAILQDIQHWNHHSCKFRNKTNKKQPCNTSKNATSFPFKCLPHHTCEDSSLLHSTGSFSLKNLNIHEFSMVISPLKISSWWSRHKGNYFCSTNIKSEHASFCNCSVVAWRRADWAKFLFFFILYSAN